MNLRLLLEQVAHIVDLAVGHIDEKDIRQRGIGGDTQLIRKRLAEKEDDRNLHDAQTQCGQQRRGRIARPVQIGQTMPEHGGQRQPRPCQKQPQYPQQQRRRAQQDQQHRQ